VQPTLPPSDAADLVFLEQPVRFMTILHAQLERML